MLSAVLLLPKETDERIEEHVAGRLKGHLVLSQIGGGLLGVPLKHDALQDMANVHAANIHPRVCNVNTSKTCRRLATSPRCGAQGALALRATGLRFTLGPVRNPRKR